MYRNEYLDKCLKENKGSGFLVRGYNYTIENELEKLTINDLGFINNNENKLNEFRYELNKANIKEFILTDSSSGLVGILYALDSVGIKTSGICTSNHIDWTNRLKNIQGLKMMII